MDWLIIAGLWYYLGIVLIWLVNTDMTLEREWKEIPFYLKVVYITVMPIGFIMLGTLKAFKK